MLACCLVRESLIWLWAEASAVPIACKGFREAVLPANFAWRGVTLDPHWAALRDRGCMTGRQREVLYFIHTHSCRPGLLPPGYDVSPKLSAAVQPSCCLHLSSCIPHTWLLMAPGHLAMATDIRCDLVTAGTGAQAMCQLS